MSKCCNDCVFYKQGQAGGLCGTCDYPVPQWLRIGSTCGGFIGNEKYEGYSCATFKSRADVIRDANEVEK